MQYPYRALNTLSNWLIGFAGLVGLGGVIAGIALATHTEQTYYYTTSHPYVWLGIALIIAGIVHAVFIAWVAFLGKVVIANGNGFVERPRVRERYAEALRREEAILASPPG